MKIQYIEKLGCYSAKVSDSTAYFLNFLTNRVIQVPVAFCEASNNISDAYIDILKSEGILFSSAPSFSFEPAYKPTSATLLMTTKCNLNCIYCYAYNSCNRDLSFSTAKTVVDYLINNAIDRRDNVITIRFHGLGEPTQNFNVLKQTVEYAKDKCVKHSLSVIFHITSNGVMEDNQRAFLIQNFNQITLSIDGTKPYQNAQRPLMNGDSFDEALKTLDAIKDKNALLIRTTVTNDSLENLEEWCDYLYRIGVKNLNIEPVSICGNCHNNGVTDLNQDFCRIFESLCEKYKTMRISYSCFRRSIRPFHCGAFGANMVITPFDDISTCYECFDISDKAQALFIIGNIKEGIVHIDNEKIKTLQKVCLTLRNKCSRCYAQAFCNGSCLSKRYKSFFEEENSYSIVANKCKITKKIITDLLTRRLSSQISFAQAERLFS